MESSSRGKLFGHPKGLYVLFFTEMWERFSYYGMRALLLLYMVNYFKWTQEQSAEIYKWYVSLVYLTPLLGGYLADRYLGNKRAIIIGATLMAIGHFCMAFEQHTVFYAALVFLIIGNGFFKPNMSTQVGRLYPANDPRRDSAYTIFYMGINLGAFLSPLICGWLRENTKWEYHAGFAAAGVGMVIGLVTYLLFIRWVEEVPETEIYQGDSQDDAKKEKEGEQEEEEHYITEEEAATVPSALPFLAGSAPTLLLLLGLLSVAAAIVLPWLGIIKLNDAVALGLGGGFSCGMGAWIVSHLSMAVRDRVLAIYVVAFFVVFFWSAFEQAGSTMNIFADKVTDRYITQLAPEPPILPKIASTEKEEAGASISFPTRFSHAFNPATPGWFSSAKPWTVLVTLVLLFWLWLHQPPPGEGLEFPGRLGVTLFLLAAAGALMLWAPTRASLTHMFNPVSTEWFQSINALAIFCLAPVFAWMWMYLPRHGIKLSIPAKVAIGVLMQGFAFALMTWSIDYENQPSHTTLAALPAGVTADKENRVVFRDAPELEKPEEAFKEFAKAQVDKNDPKVVEGGRILFDATKKRLDMTGVLSDTDRDRLLRASVTADYLLAVRELATKSQKAKEKQEKTFTVSVHLAKVPPGFDLRFAGFPKEKLRFDADTNELIASVELLDKDYKSILIAGAAPEFRDALNTLYVASAKFKVSSWWLFWFYILCTLGELCLSPVGLSMVSKLAPAKFATMLMGMWLLTSFFGNFLAGFAGERWGSVHPTKYFLFITLALAAASALAFVAVKKTRAMMHGVM